MQCNESLPNSALVTIPVGDGLVTLCQLVVGEKLAENPTARDAAAEPAGFQPATTSSSICPSRRPSNRRWPRCWTRINLQYARGGRSRWRRWPRAGSPWSPPRRPTSRRWPPTCRSSRPSRRRGGWLVLHGLTPDGLADFNQLVGFEHMIRPFRRERVTLAPVRASAAGRASAWATWPSTPRRQSSLASRATYVASDTFSYVVDLDDVAPFGTWDNGFHYNFVNGMVSADGWKYIRNDPAEKNAYILTLPKPQTIASWTWDGNIFYNPTSQVLGHRRRRRGRQAALRRAGEGEPVTFDIKPRQDRHGLHRPPRRSSRHLRTSSRTASDPRLRQHLAVRATAGGLPPAGQAAAEHRRTGRVSRKARAASCCATCCSRTPRKCPSTPSRSAPSWPTLLQNLRRPSRGKTVIAGANLAYAPIDLSKQANQYPHRARLVRRPEIHLQRPARRRPDVRRREVQHLRVRHLAGADGGHARRTRRAGQPARRGRGHPREPQGRCPVLPARRADRPAAQRPGPQGEQAFRDGEVRHPLRRRQDRRVPLCLEIDIDSYQQSGDPRPLPGAQIGWTASTKGRSPRRWLTSSNGTTRGRTW